MNASGDTVAVPPAVPNPLQGPGGARRISSATTSLPLPKGANGFDVGGSTVLPAVPTVPSPAPNAAPPAPQNPQQQIGQPPGLVGIHPGPPFDAPRSPPGSKNLSHVPCKFFRLGACQAGKACPFSHSMDPTSDQAPCKYFQKGNCKFGAKCALAHILPDGRRINRPNFGGPGHLQIGGRVDPGTYANNPGRSALHNSLLQANMIHQHAPAFAQNHEGEFGGSLSGLLNQQALDQTLSSSLPDSQFGSPRNDALAMSPLAASQRTLGPLDAGLPSSLDSNTLSHFARHGPFAASVPSKFGLDSPMNSLPAERSGALRSLYMSAFGEEDVIAGSPDLSRSPPMDGFGAKFSMQAHLSRKTGIFASSFPVTMGDWSEKLPVDTGDEIDIFEEDYIPGSLQELLTEKERIRRFSRTEEEGNRRSVLGSSVGAGGFGVGSYMEQHSGAGVVGSPPLSTSPRFGPIFMRTKREDDSHGTSGIGHVGSPLRNSYIGDSSPIVGFKRESHDFSAFPMSPPRSSLHQHSSSISGGLSQHFASMRLSRDVSQLAPVEQHAPVSPNPQQQQQQQQQQPQQQGPSKVPMERLASNASSIAPKLSGDDIDDTQFFMEEEDGVGAGGGGSGTGAGAVAGAWATFGEKRSLH